MCYLALFPPGVYPDKNRLIDGARLNPHGFGWSIGTDEVFRTLDMWTAISSFMAARARRPHETAIFHARYATGDSPRTLANCQPLVLDDGTLLAHNGALFPTFGEKSDTREFAEDFLPGWDLDSREERNELREMLGLNKMIIARPDKPLVLLNDHYGVWRPDKSWESNRDGEGVSHLAAGQCGTCGTDLPGGGYAAQCIDCAGAYMARREALKAAR